MKILLYDLENFPSLGFYYDLFREGNIVGKKDDWYLASFAYKWLGEKSVKVVALSDLKGYKRNPTSDEALVKQLWYLFNEADLLVAHNGDGFDQKKANARFIFHGLTPPKPYKTVDTLKIARQNFKFESNRLDSLGEYLGVGRKLKHAGFDLWRGCLNGDMASWKIMKKYNVQDVVLLEKVYLKLRPWHKSHPNINFIDRKGIACPKCGSPKMHSRGWYYTRTTEQRRLQCQECFAWALSEPEKLATKVPVR